MCSRNFYNCQQLRSDCCDNKLYYNCHKTCCSSSSSISSSSSSSDSCDRKRRHRKHKSRKHHSKKDKKECCVDEKKYAITKLVSNLSGVAFIQDPNLVNAWGIVYYGNKLWVADNGTGLITTYNVNGAITTPVITVPLASITTNLVGTPTGLVYNSGAGFVFTGGLGSGSAVLLTCTEDGTVSAYNGAVDANAVRVIDRSGVSAIYKGLAIANNLYVADFHNNRIDVFNTSFTLLGGFSFVDPYLPVGYAPFNIVFHEGKLYVLYAKQDAGAEDDIAGSGNGFVSVFDTQGNFIKRFISNGYLNSPWAFIAAPNGCRFPKGHILIGNFGDGTISVYGSCGKFLGKLSDCNGVNIIIDGLWGLTAGNAYMSNIYFASGPNGEANGLMGSIV